MLNDMLYWFEFEYCVIFDVICVCDLDVVCCVMVEYFDEVICIFGCVFD